MNTVKGFLALLFVMFVTNISAQTVISNDIYQLRKYKLQAQHQEFFLANFKNHTMPIMQKYGFSILSTWIEGNEFNYLLKWDSQSSIQSKWLQLMSDEGWRNQKAHIQQQYGNIIEEISEHVLADLVSMKNQRGFTAFNIGDIECIALSDGFVSLPAQPSIAPHISANLVANELTKGFRKDNIIDYPINVLLIKKDSRLILIDAGQGYANRNAGKLVGYLQSMGIQPSQITDIVISHAHTDHIDGLIDSNGKSIYSNATIHVSRVEVEFWESLDNDFANSINNVFAIVKPQIELFEDGAVIHGFIKNEIAPGHTPGHVICTIFSGTEKLVAINDLVLDVIILTHPDWGSGFDSNFEQAISTRKNILFQLSENKQLVWGSHMPYPGIGYIRKNDEHSYEWTPKFISSPTSNK
ncbi:MBL fold metallo-hydrolase [Dysgonomonas sp.]